MAPGRRPQPAAVGRPWLWRLSVVAACGLLHSARADEEAVESKSGEGDWLTPELRAAVDKLAGYDQFARPVNGGCLACEWVAKIFRTTIWPAVKGKKSASARKEAFLETVEEACVQKRYPDDLAMVRKGKRLYMTNWQEEKLKPAKKEQMAIIKSGKAVQEGAREICLASVLAKKERLSDVIGKQRKFRDVDWREVLCQRLTRLCGKPEGADDMSLDGEL